MKLIFIVLAICVVVYSEPVPPTREQLENLVMAMLENVKDAPKMIEKLEMKTRRTVEKKLSEYKLIAKMKLNLEEKMKTSGNKDPETYTRLTNCRVNNVKRFTELAAEITKDLLLQFTSENYNKVVGDGFSILKKEMSELVDVLENRADKEIELCLDGKNKCRLTNEFLATSERFFGFQDHVFYLTNKFVKSSDDYFTSKEVRQQIFVEFLQPAHKCINE